LGTEEKNDWLNEGKRQMDLVGWNPELQKGGPRYELHGEREKRIGGFCFLAAMEATGRMRLGWKKIRNAIRKEGSNAFKNT